MDSPRKKGVDIPDRPPLQFIGPTVEQEVPKTSRALRPAPGGGRLRFSKLYGGKKGENRERRGEKKGGPATSKAPSRKEKKKVNGALLRSRGKKNRGSCLDADLLSRGEKGKKGGGERIS